VGDISIQGNKRTKTYVIEREIKLKKGDLFNSTILRHSLNKLQGMGYFEDVNVGFEPSETPMR
jgi:outer membrane protein insertion porin family